MGECCKCQPVQLSKNDFQRTGRKEDGVTGNQDPTKAAAKEKGDGSEHFLKKMFDIYIFHIYNNP